MRFIILAAIAALGSGCDKDEPAPGASDDGGRKSQAELTAEYKAMEPTARLEAARGACLVGVKCAGYEGEAILDAAASELEKTSLRDALRTALLGQLQTHLAAKAKKPVKVEITGETTIFVRGHCNRFMIEDFVGSPDKRQARYLGFSRLECKDAALGAGADL